MLLAQVGFPGEGLETRHTGTYPEDRGKVCAGTVHPYHQDASDLPRGLPPQVSLVKEVSQYSDMPLIQLLHPLPGSRGKARILIQEATSS